MGLHHENPDAVSPNALRTQRMTADEAASVIALWQQERVEQTGLTDRPAVPDVAESLDIPIEEVQRLLAAVRARRVEEEAELAQEQELAEIRLAEEERKLAELQRQRAELRREQAIREPRQLSQTAYRRGKQASNPISMIVGVIFFIARLWVLLTMTGAIHGGNPFDHSQDNGGCVIALPGGTSQPCGPDFDRAHPELKDK